jgi:thiosulfate dehydrogenase (quinone) large subunit
LKVGAFLKSYQSPDRTTVTAGTRQEAVAMRAKSPGTDSSRFRTRRPDFSFDPQAAVGKQPLDGDKMELRYVRWIAGLRIYVGLLWLAYGTSKLNAEWVAPKGDLYEAAKYAADHITGPVHAFLNGVVLPNAPVFASLIAAGETLVGISLLLGLVTRAGAIGGMFLSLTYYFATGKYQERLGVESLELLLFITCLMLFALPSGSALSLDAVVRRTNVKRSNK